LRTTELTPALSLVRRIVHRRRARVVRVGRRILDRHGVGPFGVVRVGRFLDGHRVGPFGVRGRRILNRRFGRLRIPLWWD
jgi:hypothetical protein